MSFISQIWPFAQYAYESEPHISGMEIIEFKYKSDFLRISFDSERAILAFRGSDDLGDWVSNFATGIGRNEHAGFQASAERFYVDIKGFILEHYNLEFIVTGHSRGSALATLASHFIAKALKTPCSCVAFASPRVGRKHFRDEYNKLPINHIIVRNGWDIVTYNPPKAIGYRHVGKTLRLKRSWYRKYFITFRSIDHKTKSYQKAINKHAEKRK